MFSRRAFPLFIVFMVLVYAVSLHAAERVSRCIDGDTLQLVDGRTVRLAGIDTPEKARDGQPAQYHAEESRQMLEKLIGAQPVTLRVPGSAALSHGRVVAEVLLPDGQSLNGLMIERGGAFVYPHKDNPPDFNLRLLKLQQESMATGQGFWQRVLSSEQAARPYVGNRNSLRFFPVDCPEIARVNPRNRVPFGDLEEAFAAGYAPARVCPFWP